MQYGLFMNIIAPIILFPIIIQYEQNLIKNKMQYVLYMDNGSEGKLHSPILYYSKL